MSVSIKVQRNGNGYIPMWSFKFQ